MKQVQDYIRTIVDFPHEGIMFRDVTTLFADPRGFRMAIDQMLHPYAGIDIDKVKQCVRDTMFDELRHERENLSLIHI